MTTKEGALAMVNKSIDYSLANGDWQNTFTILSDDPDESWERIIQERLDELGEEVVTNKPFLNLQKMHSDSFEQVVTASGRPLSWGQSSFGKSIYSGFACNQLFWSWWRKRLSL